MQGGSFRRKVKALRDEAIARRVAAAEATKELRRLGYPDQVILPDEIYANSDNPSQDPANAVTTAKPPTATDAVLPPSSASTKKPDATKLEAGDSSEPRAADGKWVKGGGSQNKKDLVSVKRTGEGKDSKLVHEDGSDVLRWRWHLAAA